MQLSGIVGYLLTPFDEVNCVDGDLLSLHVERLIEGGVHGIAPLGSVGCLPYLSDEERVTVIHRTVQACAGRVPVLAGVSSLSTESTVRHARAAEAAGVSAIQVLPSTYWKLTEEEIFAYYRAVAEAVSIPVMAYNNPFTTGVDLPVDFLCKLTALPNISLIKEASPDPTKISKLRSACGDHVQIFVGLNGMALQGFQDGATGWCTAAPNICAPWILNFHRCVLEKKDAEATRWFNQARSLLEFLMDYGLPRAVAAGLDLCGVKSGELRQPLMPLRSEQREKLESILRTMEIVK
ncbi:TPA: dihydrodipicolinate synthase family protein [Stenotrophomonas maltophilia]|uniref:dihydrodipicolinate synthase family protein n=1 Tax=Cupriavidus pauculus TaxID=82633 RepID=UPI0007854B17|nr:dihydrodipicolinate synthase family protein [Cupriavidus pauculus]HDS1530731.1 dihydrodipicolinate synthase family protein [Stenotrophomonas maltophilia]